MSDTTQTPVTDVPEVDVQKVNPPKLIYSSALSDEENAALVADQPKPKRQGMGGGH